MFSNHHQLGAYSLTLPTNHLFMSCHWIDPLRCFPISSPEITRSLHIQKCEISIFGWFFHPHSMFSLHEIMKKQHKKNLRMVKISFPDFSRRPSWNLHLRVTFPRGFPGPPGPIKGKGFDVGPTAVEPGGGGAIQRAEPWGSDGKWWRMGWTFAIGKSREIAWMTMI